MYKFPTQYTDFTPANPDLQSGLNLLRVCNAIFA